MAAPMKRALKGSGKIAQRAAKAGGGNTLSSQRTGRGGATVKTPATRAVKSKLPPIRRIK